MNFAKYIVAHILASFVSRNLNTPSFKDENTFPSLRDGLFVPILLLVGPT